MQHPVTGIIHAASLTRKLCLMKTSDGLWTASASDGDLLLSAKIIDVIL